MFKAKIKPEFVLIDVKSGRKALHKHIKSGGKILMNAVIEIDNVWGRDDGTSREFSGSIVSHEVVENPDA